MVGPSVRRKQRSEVFCTDSGSPSPNPRQKKKRKSYWRTEFSLRPLKSETILPHFLSSPAHWWLSFRLLCWFLFVSRGVNAEGPQGSVPGLFPSLSSSFSFLFKHPCVADSQSSLLPSGLLLSRALHCLLVSCYPTAH